jgi:hypothetical protein
MTASGRARPTVRDDRLPSPTDRGDARRVLVDAYVHVGLPRFQTVPDALTVMDSSGIEKALV